MGREPYAVGPTITDGLTAAPAASAEEDRALLIPFPFFPESGIFLSRRRATESKDFGKEQDLLPLSRYALVDA
jgi:hypothetical protein